MLAVLEFVFSSFWTWLGCLILVCAPAAIIADAITSRKTDTP